MRLTNESLFVGSRFLLPIITAVSIIRCSARACSLRRMWQFD